MCGGPHGQYKNIYSSTKIFIPVQKYFFSTKIFIPVQKYLFQYKNIYSSTKIFIPVQKYLFQYKNIFSVQKYLFQYKNIFLVRKYFSSTKIASTKIFLYWNTGKIFLYWNKYFCTAPAGHRTNACNLFKFRITSQLKQHLRVPILVLV